MAWWIPVVAVFGGLLLLGIGVAVGFGLGFVVADHRADEIVQHESVDRDGLGGLDRDQGGFGTPHRGGDTGTDGSGTSDDGVTDGNT
ncbi:hypothetical protein OEB99_11410 [Actinotalea sp. M2MS4P-6]|uniref:hypothetical protein n=1 Tax=Actinotalea sp. M2MS4P-6 TaxID=2983762 RepID=UPI0021E3DCDD|nr:hypothetical protein [Actinotalea sp. M2MS4P-6]MCV2394917.1 hypothetical protein [Actinotalea sp. M2MS4P-6]